ncbi:MAG TPA: hypothetical protein VMH05_23270 [Bryobacteraceae bacterium]|nr:hypothetical protein [Bryobacteraceae bacterium]
MQATLANPTPSRTSANRLNALHSTGPRTDSGKQRSSLNALRHGLTSQTAVLPSEDPAAYQLHCDQFRAEYDPQTPSERQLVQELADTAWRLNRVPLLEAGLLATAAGANPRESIPALATIGLHGQRLSRQFQKTLDQLRALQTERRDREAHDLKRAASLLELHKHKGIPYDPVQDGFVFSISEIETHSQRLMRQNEARRVGYFRFEADPVMVRATGVLK